MQAPGRTRSPFGQVGVRDRGDAVGEGNRAVERSSTRNEQPIYCSIWSAQVDLGIARIGPRG
jgi:hypothetical protein